MRTTTIPLVLLLGAGIAPAAAQTTILNEPLQLTPSEQTTVYRTIIRERVAPAPRVQTTTRRDARRSVAGPQNVRTTRQPTVRTTTHERIVTTPGARREVLVDDALVPLSTDQSRMVYRSIIRQPDVVVTQPYTTAPVIRQRPLMVTEPDPYLRTAPIARERVYPSATTGMGPIVTTQRLMVGERVPSWVQLYSMPAATVAAVPGMARFYYAVEDDRVFLVDPTDSVIVAELYQ